MDGVQGELFAQGIKKERMVHHFLGEFVLPPENYICPICKGTGYTKGTKCVCSED